MCLHIISGFWFHAPHGNLTLTKASVARVVGWVEARPDGAWSFPRRNLPHLGAGIVDEAGFGAGKIVGAVPIHWRASTHPTQYPGYAC